MRFLVSNMTEHSISPEIYIDFYLSGDPIDKKMLNSLLSAEPDVSIAKGEPRRRKSTGEITGVYSESVWGMTSKSKIFSNEIDDHCEWLLNKVSGSIEVIRSDPALRTDIEITMVWATSFVLPPKLLELVRALDARIGVVIRRPQNSLEK